MDCFPVCKTCTGLCKERPSLPPVTVNRTRKASTRSVPRPQAIDESTRAGDILLSCDHYTSWEEVIVFEVFDQVKRPDGKFWCEKCGKWREQMKIKKRELAEIPEF